MAAWKLNSRKKMRILYRTKNKNKIAVIFLLFFSYIQERCFGTNNETINVFRGVILEP